MKYFLISAEFLISSSAFHHSRQQRDVSQKSADDNILLVQSIQITDKFGFNQEETNALNSSEDHEKVYAGITEESFTCLNGYGKFQKYTKNLLYIWDRYLKQIRKYIQNMFFRYIHRISN